MPIAVQVVHAIGMRVVREVPIGLSMPILL
jgi:hypothetical protein